MARAKPIWPSVLRSEKQHELSMMARMTASGYALVQYMALVEKAAARAGRETKERSVVTMKPSRCHSWTSVGVLKSADGMAQDVGDWTCGRDSERECLLSAIFCRSLL